MARSKARRMKTKKYDWMQTHVKLKWTEAGSGTTPYSDSVYIDVARCLSQLNRKLIRQGQLFRIKNFRAYTNDTSPNATIKVGAIPTNWVTRNSWVKAKALWDEMNAMGTQNVGGSTMYPKYHDFKVYMDFNHYSENLGTADEDLVPVDFNDEAMTTGEWDYAQFKDSGDTSDNYVVGMLGDHQGTSGNWSYVGLIKAYGESRTKPQATATSNDQTTHSTIELSPWARLFGDDDQTQDIVQDLQTSNDSPPYDIDEYVGGDTLSAGSVVGYTRLQHLNAVTGSATFGLPSFIAPCGLIRFEIDSESSTASMQPVHIQFDVDILGPMDM